MATDFEAIEAAIRNEPILAWFCGGHGAGEIGARVLPHQPWVPAEIVAQVFEYDNLTLRSAVEKVATETEYALAVDVEALRAEMRTWLSQYPVSALAQRILKQIDED